MVSLLHKRVAHRRNMRFRDGSGTVRGYHSNIFCVRLRFC